MQTHSGQRAQQDPEQGSLTWGPLRLLSFYRLILAAMLCLLFFLLGEDTSLGHTSAELYGITSLAYLGFSLAAGFAARLRMPGYRLQSLVGVLVDIVAITLMMSASGGPDSGLGILLIISVATGSVLLPGRLGFLFASIATIALLGEHFYSNLLEQKPYIAGFTRVGLMGLAFFATAALTWILVHRIQESEALAHQRGIDLANLSRLNAHIVQRLQAGIIVTDNHDTVRLINETARRLLHVSDNCVDRALADISQPLTEQLDAWRRAPGSEPTLLQQGHDIDNVLPHFNLLGTDEGLGALIFLEDTAVIVRQTQQTRLAALGRLTASIAHEIRNPLGAISHATQLLNEDNTLADEDRRLMDIIGENTGRVNAIVENVLQLSRPGHSFPQTIRLPEWLDGFVDEFRDSGAIGAGRIECSTDTGDMEVRIDPSLLHQVVWNLCQNAVQHTDKERMSIRLAAGHDPSTDQPYLDIIDNGPGIPADLQDRVFEPFYTTHSSGSGLGLFIAREICENNHMRLDYYTVESGGSRFRISFTAVSELPVASSV